MHHAPRPMVHSQTLQPLQLRQHLCLAERQTSIDVQFLEIGFRGEGFEERWKDVGGELETREVRAEVERTDGVSEELLVGLGFVCRDCENVYGDVSRRLDTIFVGRLEVRTTGTDVHP